MERFLGNAVAEHEIKHNRLVRENASECMLFLKRNGDFPIQPCSVNLYGSGARRTIKGGKGSGDVNTRYIVSVEEGLKNAGFTVNTADWLERYDHIAENAVKKYWDHLAALGKEKGVSPYVLVMSVPKPPVEYSLPLVENSDINLYVITRESSEGLDRVNGKGDYLLLDSEVRDILYLAKRKEKFLLVLNVGGVIDLSPVINEVENILLLGQLGSETGNIFADVLTGKSVPSGKLTATWAKSYSDYPSSDCFGTISEVDYLEGVYVGYRYFESFRVIPRFSFGYGLGYTDFSISPIAFGIKENEVFLSVKVDNIGGYCGKETVQIYFEKIGENSLPCKQLIAFQKTKMLRAGESQTLTVTLDFTKAAAFDEERHAFILNSGKYRIEVGNSIENTVCAAVLSVEKDFTEEYVHPLPSAKIKEIHPKESRMAEKVPLLGEKIYAPVLKKQSVRKLYFSERIANMTDEDLVRLCVGVLNDMTLDNNIGSSGKQVAGAAGETYSDENIPPLVLADGPAGLRISPAYRLDENGKVQASENALAGLLPGGSQNCKIDNNTYFQYCTAIPVGTALAQSWNVEFCRQMGNIVGKEMKLFGVDIWLAPALNIQRNPLCGRNFEYYSEDPLLSGLIAAAVANGVQSNDKCYVTIKHFCANNQERDRFFSSSNISERALREIYLKAFEICIKESAPAALMTSYNLVNGEHTANSNTLLQTVLRDEWGFEGLIMTDWLSTGGMGTGEKYGSASAAGCIAASNDLIMPGREEDYKDILHAVKANKISRKQLENSASRVLRLAKRKVTKTEVEL